MGQETNHGNAQNLRKMDKTGEHTGPESLALARSTGEVIRHWALATPKASAIAAKNKRDMSYRDLAALTDGMARQLEDAGLGPGSRLAVVHRGGAEMLTTVLGIVNCAIAVPVSNEITASEFASYLEACRIDAVIADARLDTPVREIARARGLLVIDVRGGQDADAAGHVALDLPPAPHRTLTLVPGPDDVAFVFGTSGTTRASKLVPLRHRHMVSRSQSTALLHELTATDRCFNQNRLFLCSGISNACTALYAGGCVAHPDEKGRFDLRAFIDGLRALRPTWYVASYNFNIGIHDALKTDASAVAGHSLRLIRATSGHLDPTIVAGLEQIFSVPVIEAYSSTESGRICGNPLPPRRRKHGTVGLPTLHSEVAIVDDKGHPLATGERGEVVVRGANVFDGYHDNPAANAAAFFGERYRTGDLGFFDEDGYLTLVGRIKEMINRGGQKISPVEIDDALLAHPAVADAAAFGVPHPTLGEVVGAAVVLKVNARLTEQDISAFLRERLEPIKWPRTLAFVQRIPRGPSGKVRRYQVAQLFETLRPTSPTPLDEKHSRADGAATPTEAKLAVLWTLLLQKDQLGPDDDLFLVGGDSLTATQLVLSVNELFHVELGLESVFAGASTIRTMAAKIDELKGQPITGRNPDLPLLSIDERIPRHRSNEQDKPTRKRSNRNRRAVDSEVNELFVLEKGTGLRRMRPGARFGSVQANSYGYRSPDIPLQKPPRVIRFAFLGDSLTFGSWRGGDEATWPFHTLKTLRLAHQGLAYDYVNAAMPGNGVRHVTIQFRESISKFQPDVVTLVPGGSGSRTDWARKKIGYSGVHYIPSRLGQRSPLIGLIEKNLVIWLRQIKALSDRGKLTFEPHELRELSKVFQRKLHDLVTECQNRGCLVVLLTRETKIQRSQKKLARIWSAGSRLYYEPYMSIPALIDVKDESNRVYREVAAQTGAVLVDLAGTLPPTKKYFEDSSHCTPEANRLIGERVGRALSESPQFQQLLRSRSRSDEAV
jgi:acyl-CoA synthetase (AMP-forming)/AMP-acid ligase II/acyl carrier protein